MDFGLVEIRHMVHTMFVEILSRSFHSKPVAGHGIALQAAGHTNSDVRCNYRRGVGYFRSDCTILKAKEQRHGPIRCGQRTQLQHNQEAPRRAKTNGEQARKGRDDKHQWCSFRELTTHSDADCRTQHHNKIDGGSVHCATYLYYPAVLSARDHPPDCNSEDPFISFTAAETPTEKEEYWPFAPTDEPAASFGYSTSGDIPTDASGIFGAFGGVTGEGAGSAVFMVKQGPVRGLGFRDRITGGLDFIVRALAMIVMIHYLWLSVGSSPYARVVSKTTPDIFGGITGTATSRLVRSILSRGRETTESTAP